MFRVKDLLFHTGFSICPLFFSIVDFVLSCAPQFFDIDDVTLALLSGKGAECSLKQFSIEFEDRACPTYFFSFVCPIVFFLLIYCQVSRSRLAWLVTKCAFPVV